MENEIVDQFSDAELIQDEFAGENTRDVLMDGFDDRPTDILVDDRTPVDSEDAHYETLTTEGTAEEIAQNSEQQAEQQYVTDITSSDGQPDYEGIIVDLLHRTGIQDITNIPFQDSSGAIVGRSIESLSRNELLDILSSIQQRPEDEDITDEEIDFLNALRQQDLTPQQFMQAYTQKVQQDVQDSIEPVYDVDSMSDEDLFYADLFKQLGDGAKDFTDEQLVQEYEKARENPQLFQTKMNNLRQEYKRMEQEAEYKNQQQYIAQQQYAQGQFNDSVINAIVNCGQVLGQEIDLSADDKEDLATYILGPDGSGRSQLSVDMNNPESLVQIALLATKGQELVAELYNEIKNAYKRGYAQAQRDNIPQQRVYIQRENTAKPVRKSIEQYYDADEF